MINLDEQIIDLTSQGQTVFVSGDRSKAAACCDDSTNPDFNELPSNGSDQGNYFKLTRDQYEAIKNSNQPSAKNPFVTEVELDEVNSKLETLTEDGVGIQKQIKITSNDLQQDKITYISDKITTYTFSLMMTGVGLLVEGIHYDVITTPQKGFRLLGGLKLTTKDLIVLTGNLTGVSSAPVVAIKGDKGDKGDVGIQGIQGPRGFTGEQGPIGPAGIDGKDGKAVSIIDTLPSIADLPVTGNSPQDGYLINGDLHVWNGTKFNNVGRIQGPAGPAGEKGEAGKDGSTVKLGAGLKFDSANNLTIDLGVTSLVAPAITASWVLTKADGTAYTPSVSNSKSLIVDKGVKANLSATYKYAVAGSGESYPTLVSGNFGTTLPLPNTNSTVLSVNDIQADATYQVSIAKPKSGLIVENNQVKFAAGQDVKSDSISILFRSKMYIGYSASSVLTAAQILALGGGMFATNRSRSVSNVTAPVGQFTYIAYEASFGDLTSIIMDGAAPVLTAFTKLSDVSIINEAGAVVVMRVYKSNSTQAFTNNTLVLS